MPRSSQVRNALHKAIKLLNSAGCDTPRLDAEVLLAWQFGRDRAWLHAHPEHELSPEQVRAFACLVRRRMAREPLAYVTGQREFYGLDFAVTPAVLVPRPETELLVESALEFAKGVSDSPTDLPLFIDVGTGSGAIAVSIAVRLPGARVVATDTSRAALSVARENARRHGVGGRVSPVCGDLLAPFGAARQPTVIVSNPPYLTPAEIAAAAPEIRVYEPRGALDGGEDGLSPLRRLARQAARMGDNLLAVYVEIGAGQGEAAMQIAKEHLRGLDARLIADYARLDRVLACER